MIIALDQGTTSSRAILFDDDGTIRHIAQQEFTQIFPRAGWVEHDPAEIWASQLATIKTLLAETSLAPSDVAALGITNQRETTIIWDRASGEPIHNAIVWQDRRTAPWCDARKQQGLEPEVRHRTGLVIDAYFAASKIAWILDNVNGARDRAAKGELAFGTVDAWLLWNLTRGATHATDVSNASRSMIFNINDMTWDDHLLDTFDIPREILPNVVPSSAHIADVAAGLPLQGTPVAGIAGDQQAALFGQTCLTPGLAKNTYGTGCFLLANTGTAPVASENRLISTVAWKIDDQPTNYALEGSVFIAGAIVQWLRDGLGIIKSSADVEPLARSVDSSDGVILVPALAGLGAPHWDPHARGAILGLTRRTTAAHIARAALEGIAFSVADLATAMQSDAQDISELRVDGGASNNDLLLQFQADLLQTPIVRPKVTETTALGAAYLAGLAVGTWKTTDDLAAHWTIDKRFEPSTPPERARDLRDRWNDAVSRASNWTNQDTDT